MHRREFVHTVFGAAAFSLRTDFCAGTLDSIGTAQQRSAELTPEQAAADESIWREVKAAFATSPTLLNLDNGNVCPSPRTVTQKMIDNVWLEQAAPANSIYNVELPQMLSVGQALAAQFGCSLEEIALTRNATEALDIVLLGVEMTAGDEILTTTHDYWAMQEALDQRSVREGIVVKRVPVPVPVRSMDDLVDIFESAITPRTRLILLSHPVNLTGQFFPVKRICEMAHGKGVEVCVDGAQGFAHTAFQRDDLDCDYFGTSLHKWLLAPIGTGMLYIKREKIGKVWPLVPAPPPLKERMFKFMRWGTFSPAKFLAIGDAVAFHRTIGDKRKEERLRYLTRYWVERVQKSPKIRFMTSFDSPEMSCGIATFRIEGVDSDALHKFLLQQSIIVQSIHSAWAPEVVGIRVTPNLYTMTRDLDHFCDVIEAIAQKGLPAGS